MKKFISFIILSIFLFLPLQTNKPLAVEDISAPIIEDFKILTPEISPGGKLKVKVTVTDDISGTNVIGMSFISPNKNTTLHASIHIQNFEPLTNTYIFESSTLNQYAELGEWSLQYIETRDFAQNSLRNWGKEENFEHYTFNVVENSNNNQNIIDDGFIALESKNNVSINKEFTVTFNMNIDISTILQSNIYVLDNFGNRVPLLFVIDRSTNLQTSKVTIAPVGSYRPYSAYTLYIKDIISTTGFKLSQNTKMSFTTSK